MKKLNLYADKRFEKLLDYLNNYRHIQDPEMLHQIRVEVKKIKTLLHLTEFSVKKFKSHRHFIPIRIIFRSAGEIRQLDVLYRLLLQYQIAGIPDSQIPNADKMNSMSAAFQKSVPHFLKLVKIEQKRVTKYFHKVKKSDAMDYLKRKNDELQRSLFPRFRKTDLHKVRKNAKELLYLQSFNDHRKANVFYKKVDQLIGQWHDKQLLLPVLRKCKAVADVTKLQELSKSDLTQLKTTVSRYYDK